MIGLVCGSVMARVRLRHPGCLVLELIYCDWLGQRWCGSVAALMRFRPLLLLLLLISSSSSSSSSALQEDIFLPTLTVREHLEFYANVTLSSDRYSDEERRNRSIFLFFLFLSFSFSLSLSLSFFLSFFLSLSLSFSLFLSCDDERRVSI